MCVAYHVLRGLVFPYDVRRMLPRCGTPFGSGRNHTLSLEVGVFGCARHGSVVVRDDGLCIQVV